MRKESVKLFAKRRALILEELESKEIVKVEDLSRKLGVSAVTIRKDLDIMDLDGQLERVHGGAVKINAPYQGQLFADRANLNKAAKCQIAQAVARLINNGETVMLNSGTTTCYIAEALRKKSDLLVITNSLPILNAIGHCKNLVTLFLGGRYDAEHQITYDEDAVEQLSKYRVQTLILGMDGVDYASGATTNTHTSTSITKKMLECAKTKILAADGSKIGKTALVQIAALSEFDLLVTNETAENAEMLNLIRQRGLQIVTV